MRIALALASLALPAFVLGARALAQDPAEESAAPGLADLAWMEGEWGSTQGRMEMEELWTAPKGDLILGLHRDWRQGSERASFEFLRIEAREGGLVYVAAPGGGPATEFALVELEGQRAVFENPQHEFPQRLVYEREGGALAVRIEDMAGEQGMDWRWEQR